MAPREWHAGLSDWLLSLASDYLEVGDYPTAAEVALRGLQEVIDAHAADEGLHFHDDYPYEGWAKRLAWVRSRNPTFETALERFIEALVLSCAGRDFKSVRERVMELKGLVTEFSSKSSGASGL